MPSDRGGPRIQDDAADDVRAKQDAVYQEHYASLVRQARAGGSKHAEDVVQTAFTNLFDRWHKTDTDSTLEPWLRKSVSGLVADERRARSKESLREPAAFVDTVDEMNLGPDDAIIVDERTRRIRAAISQLRPRVQRILALTFLDGMTPKAVAEQVGTTADAVRATLRRTYPKLAENLRDLLKVIFPLGAFGSWVAKLLRHPAAAPAANLTAAGAVMLAVGSAVFSGPGGPDPEPAPRPELAPTTAGSVASSPPPASTTAHSTGPSGATTASSSDRSAPVGGGWPEVTASSLPMRHSATVNPGTGPGTKQSDDTEADTPFGPAEAGGDVSTSGSVEDEPCLGGVDDCVHSADSPLTTGS